MKEFIREEKRRVQESFLWFNTRGSLLWVYEKGERRRLLKTMSDGYAVTRLAPRFDAEGNHAGSDFWLLWKSVGYNNGFQHSHTIKVVGVEEEDILTGDHEGEKRDAWCGVDLIDDLDRRHHIEIIEPSVEPNEAADWKKWLAYKKSRAEKFKRIDANILEEHLRIAEEWR